MSTAEHRILIADDSPAIRRIIRKELEPAGYVCREASDGEEALRITPEWEPDLITLDVEMPGMDGFETCKQLRNLSGNSSRDDQPLSETQVIFVTGNDTVEGRGQGFDVGATAFITKPFAPGQLAAAVRDALHPDTLLEGVGALIVDDSRTVRRILRENLEHHGMHVFLAENGPAALEQAQKHRDEIQLVLVDVNMPGMQGPELCRRLRTDVGMRETPLVALSAATEQGSILEMFKSGATDYLPKPFVVEELLARIGVHVRTLELRRILQGQVSELKRLSKLQDEFLAIASHDLRSPLTAILGFTDLMLAGAIKEEDTKKYLGRIKQSGTYLLDLISDLLDLSRIEATPAELPVQPLHLEKIVQKSVDTLEQMAGPKGLSLRIDKPDQQFPQIMGNENALIRVVNNILSNAIKFTPEGGSVRLAVVSPNLQNVSFLVVDNGIGIPAERLPHLFDQYTKTSQEGTAGEKGTGLGMAITKRLVEQLGGQIDVASREGTGTMFKVTFPAIKESSQSDL